LEGAGPLLQAALAEATAHGRDGRGTVITFAGGNGGANEGVNYDGYANSVYVTAVGAMNDRGVPPAYNEAGACLTVVAPTADDDYVCSAGGHQGIVTTDLLGSYGDNYPGAYCELPDYGYTQNFSGTSASTPIVSGVVALILQANPNLNYRDVKEILLRSATKILPTDPDWVTNSAGIAHNHKVGAGLVNAGAAIRLATNWLSLGPMVNLSLLHTNLSIPIPDYNPAGITHTLTVTNLGFRVEHVALTVTAPHQSYGDLAITLTSPGGVVSRLAQNHRAAGSGYNAWTFTSVRHWGEHANGDWTVNIADTGFGYTGTLNALHLQIQGSIPQASLALTRTNSISGLSLTSRASGWTFVIEANPSLPTDSAGWQPLGQFTLGPSGQAFLFQTNSSDSTVFYRARLAP